MTEAPSERTRVKRLNKRAKYDKETVHGILDASPVCHVGYIFKGTPYVTPTCNGAKAITSIGTVHRPAGCWRPVSMRMSASR